MANEFDVSDYRLEDGSGNLQLEDGSGNYLLELQGYPGLVLADGAVCYFRFDESSGNFIDIIGGRTGTATGSAMTYAQPGALVGDPDTSVGLSNTNQYVSVPGEAVFAAPGNSNNLTVECWVNVENIVNSTTPTIAQLGGTWTLTLNQNSLGAVRVRTLQLDSASGTLVNVNVAVDFDPLRWHHFVFVMDGAASQTRYYLDGIAVAGSPFAWGGTGVPESWTGSDDLRIGGDGGNEVTGRIDESALYPTALTADQIARHYFCGLQYFASGIGMAEPSQYPQLLAQ